jgi:hypothetical protein
MLNSHANENPTNTGYMFARNNLQIAGDLISHYANSTSNYCSPDYIKLTGPTIAADCPANGIFYGGGQTDNTNPDPLYQVGGFTTRGGGMGLSGSEEDGTATSCGGSAATACNKVYNTTCQNPDEPAFWGGLFDNLACWAGNAPILGCLPLIGKTCTPSEIDIRGYIFAGQIGGAPNAYFRLDQNYEPLMKAVQRRYYKTLNGTPIDWMEIQPPTSVTRLP